ncbi:YaaR family protein [Metabacillus sp. GX 13764]|uniref:YaaR family protein n=1 Tax=Metabacillus kandeliae TaxID=2900151 RepID=UPI001E387553|nr:YaaR family protein [Metabacillus kandeliae]MCD7036625.1 YaaR family protein [Metabacillus kandeliae]
MKINQDLRTGLESRIPQQGNAAPARGFHEAVQKQENKLQIQQLNKLIGDLETAGAKLSKSRNFSDLAKFKGIVKRFINEAVDYGLNLKQSRSWDFSGNGRSLNVVQQVDRKLIDLTDEVVNKEKGSLDILAKVGEIKGLLINLYT